MGSANGYWLTVASGQEITLSISNTFSSSKTESSTASEQYTLSQEMKVGIEFESDTITETYAVALTQASEETYSKSNTNTISISCATGGEQTGLYQWVTETSGGESKALTALTICRTGSGVWNTMPACPWSACNDGACTQCLDWKA